MAVMLCGCIIVVNSVNGSGFVVKESRAVSGVTKVVLSGCEDLRISIGETESLVIETDDNLMRNITTEQNGSTLIIRNLQALELKGAGPKTHWM